jgi:hypothetical protein
VSLRERNGCVHSDARACELTPHGATLGAATGRSQARAPEFTNAHQLHSDVQASELAGLARSQGCLPAQPARPAGGPLRSSSSIGVKVVRSELALVNTRISRRAPQRGRPAGHAWRRCVAQRALHRRSGARFNRIERAWRRLRSYPNMCSIATRTVRAIGESTLGARAERAARRAFLTAAIRGVPRIAPGMKQL